MKIKSWRTIGLSFFAALLVVALLLVSFQIDITPKNSNSKVCITIGNRSVVEASGLTAPDYYTTGINDNIPFQQALNALPAVGGELMVLSGTYNFSATVTRAIANVTIVGTGAGSYFTYDGVNPIFTAGGNKWKFENLRTDAGSLNMGATTGWIWENVTINATCYTYLTDSTGGFDTGTVTATSLEAPTGRTASYVIAASTGYASAAEESLWKEQSDVTCIGVNDDVVFQSALDAGFYSIQTSPGDFVFAATVSKAVDDVLIRGSVGTTFANNDATALFTVGGRSGWIFENIKTDAGGITTYTDTIFLNVTELATTYVLAQNKVPIMGDGGDYSSAVVTTNQTVGTELESDKTFAGSYEDGTIGETLIFGDICYLKTDSKWWHTDATSSTSSDGILGICVVGGAAEAIGRFLTLGYVRCDSYNWVTIQGSLYISTSVGLMSQNAPSGAGQQIRKVGFAKTPHIIYFCPDTTIMELN